MNENISEQIPGGSFTAETKDVRVTVIPTFIAERSEISAGIFAHSYKVTLENLGTETVQLLNRHWKVLSAGKQIADVKGEGVIGEQPVLEPSEEFTYESWTVVRDPIGSMFGTYTFVSENGEFFDVKIPEFPLIHMDDTTLH